MIRARIADNLAAPLAAEPRSLGVHAVDAACACGRQASVDA
jgi:hypothetical protein